MNQPIFQSTEHAIEVLFTVVARLGGLVVWTIFGLAHVAVAAIGAFVLWWFQVSPADIQKWMAAALQSNLATTYVALGGSAVTLLTGYAWLLRKAHRWAGGGPLFDYLIRTLR